jgi:hypothetical protein
MSAESVTAVDVGTAGVGWFAAPTEMMQRAAHAFYGADDRLWLVDPIDVPGLDEFLASHGTVGGVIVAFDRHRRDAAQIARRYDLPVTVPPVLEGFATSIPTETRVRSACEAAGIEFRTLIDARVPPWREAAVIGPDGTTVYIPEVVGRAGYYTAPGETVGVHPMLRVAPPRAAVDALPIDTLWCGHGRGLSGAQVEVDRALRAARTRLPAAYLSALRGLFS